LCFNILTALARSAGIPSTYGVHLIEPPPLPEILTTPARTPAYMGISILESVYWNILTAAATTAGAVAAVGAAGSAAALNAHYYLRNASSIDKLTATAA
jgi:hypothetical protein